jgi:hypothetical protein
MKTKPLLFAALALSIPAHAEVLWRGSFGEPGTQCQADQIYSPGLYGCYATSPLGSSASASAGPVTQTFANGVFSVNETVAGFTRTPFISGTYTTASDMASADFWTVRRSDFSTMCDGAP